MKGLSKWLGQIGIGGKSDDAISAEGPQPEHSPLFQEFLSTLCLNDRDKQFRSAARLVANHNYTESLDAYCRLQKLYPEKRSLCEIQVGMVFMYIEEYKRAFDSFLAAKVHGADEAESERRIWDACTGILSKNVSHQQKTECIDLYLRLFPNGKHLPEARALVQVGA
ncbi:MAG: hypothetical protein KF690_02320 [Bacteroidetes bacterium]|nr:hypothetical protein [Bacteroidota bacterium]